ncbi:MAG: DUF1801 domain-containing protein [Gemmatimonadaceae bacterium]|nr:DUF1801 domain-containing protein [Gemmatimonadaceae bacterium]
MSDALALLKALGHPMEPVILAIRELILGVDPAVTESVKWNAPSYATSEHFATFNLRAKGGVQLVLHLGAAVRAGTGLRDAVPDPLGLLEWKSADRALITFASGADVQCHAAAFRDIVATWITFVQAPATAPAKRPGRKSSGAKTP